MIRPLFGKLLYGGLFLLVLPLLLVLWARGTHALMQARAIFSPSWGIGVVAAGFALVISGMLTLRLRGDGLPMNAYPPPRLVASGIYAIFPHPIYLGFVLVCAGASIAAGSASGLWLITPTVALASAALVLGYEAPDLRRRFEASALPSLLPPDEPARPALTERVRCVLFVLLPWLIAYEAVVALGIPADAVQTYLHFERRFPVVAWSEIIYATPYLVVCVVPWMVSTRRTLRAFCLRAWISMAVTFPLYLALPLIAPPRPVLESGFWAHLLHWERSIDSAAASFPSYHVIWAFVAADALGQGTPLRKVGWKVWAFLVSLSCLTTGMHSLVDIVGGYMVYQLAAHAMSVWNYLLLLTEAVANSWREYRFGPVRVINHGAYAGLAALVGAGIIDSLLGPGKDAVTITIFLGGTLGAVLWAQWVEGSPSLLRPLGFYGGMLGCAAGALVARQIGISVWTALCGICVAAPFIQSIGRVRCLVQGCCHGRPTQSVPGIRYTHPRSRVCRMAELSGVPVHPTPLYSILWNGVIALVLCRLLILEVPATTICGIYLLLSGLGRFVEEAYRGEPQTLVSYGLRLYQWIAIATVLAGAFVTTIGGGPKTPLPVFHATSLALAGVCGLAGWFVSGIDFPESSRRFARLT
jgi:protein-S-isoprenylcysteine O-methyltransferase Ste14